MRNILLLLFTTLFFLGCQSKVAKEEDIATDQISESIISPHSVLVKAEVLNVKEKLFEIKIIKSIRYGSNTPTLKGNKILKLRIPKGENISVGIVLEMILVSETSDEDGGKNTYWSLSKIVKRGK